MLGVSISRVSVLGCSPQGWVNFQYVLQHENSDLAKHRLTDFVLRRLKLKGLPEN
jgi:hypothetical protein